MDGSFYIGSRAVTRPGSFHGIDPATDQPIAPGFAISTSRDVAEACRLADAAFDSFRETPPTARATFLETAADEIDAIGEALVERAHAETRLPLTRLSGEVARTSGQLRMFARVLREGRWAGVVIDPALPDRVPTPRPDIRQRRIAVGPVAIFGASNFPLAFSVAGGDTASALAAGCPVVVKAHPAHPGTSSLVVQAMLRAAKACALPEGVFSMVQGPDNGLGATLVSDPRIKAVGFTGSRAGGLALVEIARQRAEPIPVYAEMASINPVILFPAALTARAQAMGEAYVASLTLGAGQYCTNPGIVLGVDGPDLDSFVASAAAALEKTLAQTMLTPAIHAAFEAGVEALASHLAVTRLATGMASGGCSQGQAGLFSTSAKAFLSHPELAGEIFGPVSLIIRCADERELGAILQSLEGQLTATLQVDPADHAAARRLLPLLERKAGRILANGWPTGVEVSHAMVHGGPFPATSDPRTTSVGAAAIERFLRPVCYQNLPDALLPQALQDANPLSLPRLVS